MAQDTSTSDAAQRTDSVDQVRRHGGREGESGAGGGVGKGQGVGVQGRAAEGGGHGVDGGGGRGGRRVVRCVAQQRVAEVGRVDAVVGRGQPSEVDGGVESNRVRVLPRRVVKRRLAIHNMTDEVPLGVGCKKKNERVQKSYTQI